MQERVIRGTLALIGAVIFAGSFLFFSATSALAATITVNTTADENGSGTDCSLREAIISANNDSDFGGCTGVGLYGADTIVFDSTVFSTLQTINLTNGALTVTSPITFTGPAANVIVNQDGTTRVMQMDSGPVTMTDMTIQGGSINGNGSGILINNNTGVATDYIFGSGVVVRNNVNTGTSAFGGGMAAFNNAQVYLQNGMQLINNTGRSGGGIFLNFKADLFVNGATISGNTATVQGGGIRISGTGDLPSDPTPAGLTLTNATITNNQAQTGGGVYLFGPAVGTITGGSISNNTATGTGLAGAFGGIAAEGNLATSGGQLTGAPTVNITGTTFNANIGRVAGGAGGATVGASITLTDVTVSSNQTTAGAAAGLGNGGGFSVSNIGTNNPAWSVASSLTINGATSFTSNTAVRDGGGVFVTGAGSSVTVNSGTFTSNVVPSYGGGIAALTGAIVDVNGGTFTGNQATGSPSFPFPGGGGIMVGGTGSTGTISGATIGPNNYTSNQGGGVYVLEGANVTIDGGTTVNSNGTGFVGGGVSVEGLTVTTTLTITGSGTQVNSNTGPGGAGVTVWRRGNVTISDQAQVNNNTTSVSAFALGGGGIAIGRENTVLLDNARVSSNTAADGNGGGIRNGGGTLTIQNGTQINGNTATIGNGGAISVETSPLSPFTVGTLNIVAGTSVVISNNSAPQGNGGGIYAITAGAITVDGARIQGNSAVAGGAFFQASSSPAPIVTNSCIVCNSDNAVDYSGGALPMSFGGNWWGSAYGPYYSTSTDGLQCSTGDSLNSGNPLAQYGITVSTPSDPQCNAAPIGNWSATPLATCDGSEITLASSLSPARICPRNP